MRTIAAKDIGTCEHGKRVSPNSVLYLSELKMKVLKSPAWIRQPIALIMSLDGQRKDSQAPMICKLSTQIYCQLHTLVVLLLAEDTGSELERVRLCCGRLVPARHNYSCYYYYYHHFMNFLPPSMLIGSVSENVSLALALISYLPFLFLLVEWLLPRRTSPEAEEFGRVA